MFSVLKMGLLLFDLTWKVNHGWSFFGKVGGAKMHWLMGFTWKSAVLMSIHLNPRLTGGGGRLTPPLPNIRDSSKTNSAIDVNLAGLLIQQFYIVRGNFFEIRRKFFEIWSILWRHYTPLLVENWPNFTGLWKTQFLIKTQMKNTKRRKMRSSTRWLSRFFKILGLWPLKFQKIDFFGKWSLKSKIFKIFKKPEHMLFIY